MSIWNIFSRAIQDQDPFSYFRILQGDPPQKKQKKKQNQVATFLHFSKNFPPILKCFEYIEFQFNPIMWLRFLNKDHNWTKPRFNKKKKKACIFQETQKSSFNYWEQQKISSSS